MDYEEKTVEELRKLAAERNISGRAEMNKAELVSALNFADSQDDRVGVLERRLAALETRVNQLLPADPVPKTR